MSKIKYEIELPKSIKQLESFLQQVFKQNPNKHYVIKLYTTYLNLDDLVWLITKYKKQIIAFRKNKSIVLLSEDFDYEQLPDFIPLAPTEEEAIDIIEFEEIEKDIMLND